MTGVYSVTSAAERREKIQALVKVRGESLSRLESAPYLAKFLRTTNTSPTEYLSAVLEWAAQRPVVVVLSGEGGDVAKKVDDE
jgi:hypothetical protein